MDRIRIREFPADSPWWRDDRGINRIPFSRKPAKCTLSIKTNVYGHSTDDISLQLISTRSHAIFKSPRQQPASIKGFPFKNWNHHDPSIFLNWANHLSTPNNPIITCVNIWRGRPSKFRLITKVQCAYLPECNPCRNRRIWSFPNADCDWRRLCYRVKKKQDIDCIK